MFFRSLSATLLHVVPVLYDSRARYSITAIQNLYRDARATKILNSAEVGSSNLFLAGDTVSSVVES
jgi:hypothetical protein